MDACPIMETDGSGNQRNLLARLVIVYSGAIGASDNHTLSSRNVETPTDLFRAILNANSGARLRTSNNLHHMIINHRTERVA